MFQERNPDTLANLSSISKTVISRSAFAKACPNIGAHNTPMRLNAVRNETRCDKVPGSKKYCSFLWSSYMQLLRSENFYLSVFTFYLHISYPLSSIISLAFCKNQVFQEQAVDFLKLYRPTFLRSS